MSGFGRVIELGIVRETEHDLEAEYDTGVGVRVSVRVSVCVGV